MNLTPSKSADILAAVESTPTSDVIPLTESEILLAEQEERYAALVYTCMEAKQDAEAGIRRNNYNTQRYEA